MLKSAFQKQLNLSVQKNLSYITHLSNEVISKNVYDFDVFLPSIGKNLQRPLVWSLEQKQQLILVVLKGNNIGNISVIEQHDNMRYYSHFEVIDGKQRLTTLFSFVKNEFPIVFEGKEYYFKDFDKEDKMAIDSIDLNFDVVHAYPDKVVSDVQKIAWFESINFLGTPQDIKHLNNLKTSLKSF